MAAREPILHSLSLLLDSPTGPVTKNGMLKNGITKLVDVKTEPDAEPCENGDAKSPKTGEKNGICRSAILEKLRRKSQQDLVQNESRTEEHPKSSSSEDKNAVKKSPPKRRRKGKRKRRFSRVLPPEKKDYEVIVQDIPTSRMELPPVAPEKRLNSLIDRLTERTNHDTLTSPVKKSPTKRPRQNSLLFEEESSPKKIKIENEEVKTEEGEEIQSDSGLEPECSIQVVGTEDITYTQRTMTLAVARVLNLEQEISLLKQQLTLNKIPLTDESVRVYSGLPNLQVFNAVYEKIKPMVLKIRCKKDRKIGLRIHRKYRRIFKAFVRTKRLNLKDEFLIAMMHARNKMDYRDTAKRYGITVGQCWYIVRFWASFLPYELSKALMALSHLLPKSKWTGVPEYVPSTDRDTTPCSDSSFESTTTDSSSKSNENQIQRVENENKVQDEKCSEIEVKYPFAISGTREPPPRLDNCTELRKLISESSSCSDHEGFFDAKSNYVCEYCFSFHESNVDLMDHIKSRFEKDYDSLRQQFSDLKKLPENQRLKCCVCGERRQTLRTFLAHLSDRHLSVRNPAVECKACKRYFDSREIYDTHVKQFHQKKAKKKSTSSTFFCDRCCLVLETEELYAEHKQRHEAVDKDFEDAQARKNQCPFFEHKNPKVAIPRLAGPKDTKNTVTVTVPKIVDPTPVRTLASPVQLNVSNGNATVVESAPLKLKITQTKSLKPKPAAGGGLKKLAPKLEQKIIQSGDVKPTNMVSQTAVNTSPQTIAIPEAQKLELQKIVTKDSNFGHFKLVSVDGVKVTGSKTVDNRIRCPFCPKTFQHRVTLKVHMTQHTGQKPHKCSICDKRFFRKNDLVNHERIHTGEKPFTCQYCGSKFAHSCSLAAHIRQTCSKIPSECEICGRKCDNKMEFEVHMKKHLAEGKSFRCNICGKTFISRHHLAQHRNIHKKRFPCGYCSKMFASKDELDEHSTIHDEDSKPKRNFGLGTNNCHLCHKSFTRTADLRRHLKKFHMVYEKDGSTGELSRDGELDGFTVKEEVDDIDEVEMKPLLIAE